MQSTASPHVSWKGTPTTMTGPSSFEIACNTNRSRLSSAARAVGRRSLLRGVMTGGLAVAGATALSACGVKGHVLPPGSKDIGVAGRDYSDVEKTVVFANWPAYIDVNPKNPNGRPTLDSFTRQTGVSVQYLELISDNNDWYTKIDPSLVRDADTGYDIMVVSDYMVSKYRTYDYIQALDLSNIPNHSKLLPSALHDPADPGRLHSIPWAYGYTTVAYNSDLVKQPVTSIAELFTRSDLNGKVCLFSEMPDTIALALLAQGMDPEHFTDAQFNQALEYIRRARDAGQIRSFSANDYLADFQQGNSAVTMAYSGDIAQLGKPNLVTVDLPKEGLLAWSDNMVIPNFARHKKNAEKLMNHYLQPGTAAALDDYIRYIPSVEGAVDALKQIDPTAAAVPLIAPTKQMRAKTRGFMALSNAQLNDYTSRFQQLTGQ